MNKTILILGAILFVVFYLAYAGLKRLREQQQAEAEQKAREEQEAQEEAERQKKLQNQNNNNTSQTTTTTPKAKSFSNIFISFGLQKKLQDVNNKYGFFGVKVPDTKNGLYAELAKYGLNKGDTIVLD